MCIQTTIQNKIAELTGNGDAIAEFLADTMRGQSDRDIKICHRLDAARMLAKYGIIPVDDEARAATPSPLMWEVPDADEISSEHAEDDASQNPTHPVHPVSSAPTLRDIVAYPLARYIRSSTNDGETLLRTLCSIMNGEDSLARTDRQVKRHHRLSAARELLRRAFGEYSQKAPSPSMGEGSDADETLLIDATSGPLNARLAKLTRDLTDGGIEAAELLIRIAGNDDYEEDWTPGHRLAAAKELLHRGYDLNYEAVTWDHIDAYNRANDASADIADEGAELMRHRIESGRSAIMREFGEAYESGDEDAMKTLEDKFNAYNSRIKEGADPDDAMAYAELGPNDPDPDAADHYKPLSPEQQKEFNRRITQLHDDEEYEPTVNPIPGIAAYHHTPKLTIPINNRSP